jgi:DNA-binding response OmpR family regulator
MQPADDAPLVLVIDDEPGIRDFVALGLRQDGFRVVAAATGSSGMDVLRRDRPHAVILDAGLPDADGFDLIGAIRSLTDVPIVMLTARGDLDDRVRGLELGADDYIAKPFHFAELVARLRVHLRRRSGGTRTIGHGGVTLDPRAHTATRGGRSIALTPRESELLELFLRHPGEVLSKEVILDRLWGYAFDDNLVEVYIGYLRRKLGDPAVLHTQRGAGYVLRGAEADPGTTGG